MIALFVCSFLAGILCGASILEYFNRKNGTYKPTEEVISPIPVPVPESISIEMFDAVIKAFGKNVDTDNSSISEWKYKFGHLSLVIRYTNYSRNRRIFLNDICVCRLDQIIRWANISPACEARVIHFINAKYDETVRIKEIENKARTDEVESLCHETFEGLRV